jgi:hypothetical protein
MRRDLDKILPEFEPKPNLWNQIEQALDFEDLLQEKIMQLPDYEPVIEMWANVLEAISTEKEATKTINFPIFIRWVAAASVLLIMGFVWYFYRPSEEIMITYSVEKQSILKPENNEHTSNIEANAEAFIKQQCEEIEVACMKPEVKELRQELAQLNTNQKELEAQMEQFGNDPALVQAQIKIENQKAEITKELINILRS